MSDWRTLASPAGDGAVAAPAATGAPSWQAMATPVETPADKPPNLTDREKMYRADANMGWLGKIHSALGGFNDQMGRTLTMGLSDKLAALEPATIHAAAKGVNALFDAAGHEVPFPEAEKENFADIYHENLAKERGADARYAEEHPVASPVAKVAGLVASIPATSGARMLGVAAQGAPLAAEMPNAVTEGMSLGKKIWQATKQGAAIGGIGGFGTSNDESLKKDLIDTTQGAVVGGALNAGLTAAGEKVIAPVINWAKGRFGADALGNAASRQVMERIAQSSEAGGPTAQDMLDLIAAHESKPLMLADVGGAPVQALGEGIATRGGAGRQIASQALDARDAAAGVRVADEVGSALGNGGSNHATEQALIDARSAAAAPAYKAAGIPSDPAEYANAPVVDNAKVTNLLKKSKDVRAAIAQAKSLPDYADLPDNSMVLLDKAYKNIGGTANAAKISGNGEAARDMNSLRVKLLDAMTDGDAGHPYHQALKEFSGPSQSLGAIKDGASFAAKSPDQIAAEIAELNPNDREFYRLGAANALKTQIAKTSQGGNEALKISGNDYVKQQLRALTGSKDAAEKLIKAADLENTMFQTKTNTLGNSRTALRAAENAAENHGGIVPALAQTVAGLGSGEAVVGSMGAMNLAKQLVNAAKGTTPKIDAATAKMLFSPDAATNKATLARIIAMAQRKSMAQGLSTPLVEAGATVFPRISAMPQANSGDRQ